MDLNEYSYSAAFHNTSEDSYPWTTDNQEDYRARLQ